MVKQDSRMSLSDEQATRLKHHAKIIAEGYGTMHDAIVLFDRMSKRTCYEDCERREDIDSFIELLRKQSYMLWQMARDLGDAVEGMMNNSKEEKDEK